MASNYGKCCSHRLAACHQAEANDCTCATEAMLFGGRGKAGAGGLGAGVADEGQQQASEDGVNQSWHASSQGMP